MNVQLSDFHHQGSLQTGQVAVNVIGGSNGTHVGVRDVWYDGSDGGGQIADITGASTFTYAGSILALSRRQHLLQ